MKLADLIGTMKRHQDAGPNFNLARIAAKRSRLRPDAAAMLAHTTGLLHNGRKRTDKSST
jgi:hypothetical protein